MKFIVFAVMLLGVSAFGDAQTQAPTFQPMGLVNAGSTTQDGDVMQLRGGVEIGLGEMGVLTADEADVNRKTADVELRGNVRLRRTQGR